MAKSQGRKPAPENAGPLTAEEIGTLREIIALWKLREARQRFKYEGGETSFLNVRIPKALREEIEAEASILALSLSDAVRDRLIRGRKRK